MERTNQDNLVSGSKDGSGAADHDEPYTFGRRPRAVAPWPFTERQFAHLLMMRGRVGDDRNPLDELHMQPSQELVKRQQARRRKAA